MGQILLLNVSGHDQPGLTQSLTAILDAYQVRVLDIGQAVVHDELALGLLIEVGKNAPALQGAILAKVNDLGVHARFSEISEPAFRSWIGRGRKIDMSSPPWPLLSPRPISPPFPAHLPG